MENPEIIIIGTGPSGIALAHTLKHKLGFDDFTVSVQEAGVMQTTSEICGNLVLRQARWPRRYMATEHVPRSVRNSMLPDRAVLTIILYPVVVMSRPSYIRFHSIRTPTGRKNYAKGPKSLSVRHWSLKVWDSFVLIYHPRTRHRKYCRQIQPPQAHVLRR